MNGIFVDKSQLLAEGITPVLGPTTSLFDLDAVYERFEQLGAIIDGPDDIEFSPYEEDWADALEYGTKN